MILIMIDQDRLQSLARLIRKHIITATTIAGSGHASSALSAVELMAVLFFGGVLKFDADHPEAVNNDRVIFSKGHAAPLLYALYAAAGRVTEAEMNSLRQFQSPLEGHPTPRFKYAEAATGSLGQGLSIGAGMALNAQYLDHLPYRTYVLLGDSEMSEGSIWEAVQIAAHYKLHQLVGILDVNRLGQRGETMLGHDLIAYQHRLEAFGWHTITVDGHNISEVHQAYQKTFAITDRPTMIIAKTIKGKGVRLLEDQEGWHGKALSQKQLQPALFELGEIDEKLIGTIAKPTITQPADISTQAAMPITSLRLQPKDGKLATRKAYGNALLSLGDEIPQVVVMDAEMSNSTFSELFTQAFPDRFFEMFIAEQNMVSLAVGLAHRGKIPFISTFGAFMTRAFDQLRMAQYSQANIKIVGSHVGVSMGQDGSSQMALEDIAMMRAIRESMVLYPADAISTEKLVTLMAQTQGICYLRTTRDDTPILYDQKTQFKIGGSHTLRQSSNDQITVVAAGITVHEALTAYDELRKQGIFIRVIDLYSIKPLDVDTLTKAARETKSVIVVEDHYPEGGIGEAVATTLINQSAQVYSLAVNRMPVSGKSAELLNYMGISASAIVRKVHDLV